MWKEWKELEISQKSSPAVTAVGEIHGGMAESVY